MQKPLSLTPTPTPPPTPRNRPETNPKQTRNGAKRSQTEPKQTETEPKWTEIKLSGVGRPGVLLGWGGGCKGTKTLAKSASWMFQGSSEFQKRQPPMVPKKVRQDTSNLYGSTPPFCIAGPSWLLSLEERETQQYTSHLYCSTPPICTAVFLRKYWGLGSTESS